MGRPDVFNIHVSQSRLKVFDQLLHVKVVGFFYHQPLIEKYAINSQIGSSKNPLI